MSTMNRYGTAPWRKICLIGVLTTCAGMSLAATVEIGETLDCVTESKFECDAAGCRGAEEGYADTERYRLDLAARELTACLWSTCYAGPAAAWVHSDTSIRSAWQLRSEEREESLLLTLKLLPTERFETTYSTDGASMSVAFGRCTRSMN
jgi:hypothetical protein